MFTEDMIVYYGVWFWITIVGLIVGVAIAYYGVFAYRSRRSSLKIVFCGLAFMSISTMTGMVMNEYKNNETNKEALQTWSHDRYGITLSEDSLESIVENSSQKDYSTILVHDDSHKMVGVQWIDNSMRLVSINSADGNIKELPVKNS